MGRRSVWKMPKRKHSEWKEPYEMLNKAKPLNNNNTWAEEGQRKSPKMNQSNWKGALQNHSEKNRALQNAKKNKTTKKKSSDRRRSSKNLWKQHLENIHKWHLCTAGSFSYGESLRTPPLEGTSLHRWNNSVERPWRILSLFTTCLQVQSPCQSLWHMWNTPHTAH